MDTIDLVIKGGSMPDGTQGDIMNKDQRIVEVSKAFNGGAK